MYRTLSITFLFFLSLFLSSNALLAQSGEDSEGDGDIESAPCAPIEGREYNNDIYLCEPYKNFYIGADQNTLIQLGNRFFVGGVSQLNGKVGIGVSAINSSYLLDVGGNLNLLGGASGYGRALFVKDREALWLGQNLAGDDYFSWGYGADFNFFKDGISIGYNAGNVQVPPTGGLASFGDIVGDSDLQIAEDAIVSGNVGIGVSAINNNYKLDVAGKVNIQGTGKVLYVNDKEAIWFNNDYFSWGHDGNWNYFRDGLSVGFGTVVPPVNNGMNIAGPLGVKTQSPNPDYAIHSKGRISAANWNNLNKEIIIGHDGANATISATNAARLHVGLGDNLNAMVLGSKNQGDNTDMIVSGEVFTCKVNTTEVEVKTGWCDYVFEKDYPLMPLEDVEKFIEANHHLPNIPPASVVEKEGLQMADMQVRMMEKIEELTLHIIAQNNKIKELEARIK